MAEPLLQLLGSPRLHRAGGATHELPNTVPGFLAAWLALRADWVTRESLGLVFWPDMPAAQVLLNLRVNLHRLRQWLEGVGLAEALHAEKRRVRLLLPTDVATFRSACGAGHWAQALAHYRGPLLQGASLPGLASVDAWQQVEREALAQAHRHGVLQQVRTLQERGEPRVAAELLRQHLARQPGAEELLQAMLRLAPPIGEATSALALYEQFVRSLAEESGQAPMPATAALAAAMRGAPEGQAGAAPACAAAAPDSTPRRSLPAQLAAPPLVGRDREREQLRAAVGPGRLVVLRGEAGVGKTRLAESLWPQALWWHCQDAAGLAAPFHAVAAYLQDSLEALRELASFRRHQRVLARLVPEALPLGEAAAPVAAGDSQLHEALLALFHELGRPLVVDDLQWADAQTLALLRGLLAAGRLAVLATQRSGVETPTSLLGPPGSVCLIDLSPLSADALARLLAELSGQQAGAPRFTRWLHARSAGNPLFALEALRTLFAEGRLRDDGGGWHSVLDELAAGYDELTLPPQVAAVVRLRLATLGEGTQRVLRAAAVAGHARWLEPLAALAGLPALAAGEALGEAQTAGVLHGRRFAHDLLRQAVLDGMPEALLAATHAAWLQQAGRLLQPRDRIFHAWAAGDESAAVQASIEAAAGEAERGQHEAAEALLGQTLLRLAEGSHWAASLRALRAQIWLQQGRLEQAAQEAQAALQELPTPQDRALAFTVRGEVALQQGRVGEVQALALAALQAEPAHDGAWMLQVKAAHAQGHYAQAEALLQQRLALLRRQAPGPEWVNVLTSLGATIDYQGRHAEALPVHQEALALAQRLGLRYGEVEVAVNLVWCLPELDRHDEAMALAERALALGEFDASATLANNLAYLYLLRGRWADAERHYRHLAQGAEPTLACVSSAKLLQIQAQASPLTAATEAAEAGLQAAAQAVLAAMDRTDHPQAHAIAVLALLDHGPASCHAQALARQPVGSVDAELQARLQAAVARVQQG